MVSSNVLKGTVISLAAVGSMMVGFYIQDEMMRSKERQVKERVDGIVDIQLAKRKAAALAKLREMEETEQAKAQ